ncbi:MAG: hypothetical protein IK118_09465 [Clostridia bacterium]|nr:hypothetical protein [Clostridia bacterium]MBR5428563.1 hypothetical protein [Clostridia bacterium]
MTKLSKKILAIVLAALLACTVIPFAAFAADEDAAGAGTAAETRVNAWDVNYGFILDELFDDAQYTHWKYVAQNTESISKTMKAYTAFGLYDEAWRNAFDESVSVKTAKEILVGLCERVDPEINTQISDTIVKALEGAADVMEFIEKVNGYADKYLGKSSELVESSGFSSALGYLNTAIQIANFYQRNRDKIIEAYAKILTARAAGEYYADLLGYVAENAGYSPLQTAAEELIEDINASLEEVYASLAEEAAANVASEGVSYLINIAMDSNVYTAAVKKVYNIGTSVADALFNTSDQYVLMDSLMIIFYFSENLSDWASAAYDNRASDYNKALYAIGTVLATRATGESTLYNLKAAQAGGIIGRIKSKIYKAVTEGTVATQAKLALAQNALIDTDPAEYKGVITSAVSVYCPVTLTVGATTVGDEDAAVADAAGNLVAAKYNAYNKEYVKVAYVAGANSVALNGTGDGDVTAIINVLENGKVEDYSFTDVAVANGTSIVINIANKTYSVNGGAAVALNEDYIPSPEPDVDAGTVVDAVVEVGKEEVTEKVNAFKAFFQKIIEFFKNLFRFGK